VQNHQSFQGSPNNTQSKLTKISLRLRGHTNQAPTAITTTKLRSYTKYTTHWKNVSSLKRS